MQNTLHTKKEKEKFSFQNFTAQISGGDPVNWNHYPYPLLHNTVQRNT
jgi:hypothetical protein